MITKNSLSSLITFSLAITLIFSAPQAFAQIPQTLRYEGTLTDAQGVPLSGSFEMTFRLYTDPLQPIGPAPGGGPWTESHPDILVEEGHFSVSLGTINNADADPNNDFTIPLDTALWLSMEVNQDGEMTERVELVSVPYAFQAEGAYTMISEEGSEVPASTTPQAGKLLVLDAQGKLPEASLPDTISANQLNGFTASATPAPNTLLALDAQSKFPASALPDALDAATLGGNTASNFYDLTHPSFTGILPVGKIPTGEGSGLDADTLRGAAPGSGNGLDADTVDGYQASPGMLPNTIPVLDSNGELPMITTHTASGPDYDGNGAPWIVVVEKTITTGNSAALIVFSAELEHLGGRTDAIIEIDGVDDPGTQRYIEGNAITLPFEMTYLKTFTAGSHTIKCKMTRTETRQPRLQIIEF